jgi:DNA-binding NarL/FixJ family response regulator
VATAVDPGESVVVGIADAISVTERLRPAITVLEMELPASSGFHVTQELVNRRLTSAVVIHTAFADDGTALAALVAGASAVVVKGGPGNELTDAVRAAARGGGVRPRVTIDALVEAAGMVDPDDIPILSMLVHGTSPAEIGEVLGVHERELAGRRRRMLNALLGEVRV